MTLLSEMRRLPSIVLLAAAVVATEAKIQNDIRLSSSHCPAVPPQTCANLYSGERCSGDVTEVQIGNSDKKVNTWLYTNDMMSVSVRRGCSLAGYEMPEQKGKGIVVR